MKMNKQFDCIKLKNEIQKSILDETSEMNTGELLKYFNSDITSKPQIGGEYQTERAIADEYTSVNSAPP